MKKTPFIILGIFIFFSCENIGVDHYLEGKKQFDNGEFDNAIKLFTREINVNGGTDLAYYYRGRSSQKKREFQNAIEDYIKAIEMNNELSEAHVNRAVSHIRLKEYDIALKGLDKMLSHFKIGQDSITTKNIVIALNNRGLLKQHHLKDSVAALADYNKSVRIGKDFPNYLPYRNRGKLYFRQKNYEKALKDFNSAILLNNNDSEIYYGRGQAKYHLGDIQNALLDTNVAIELDKTNWSYYNQRGIILNDMEKHEEAISDFTKAIEISDHAYAYNNRGFSYYKLGNLKQALVDCEKSLELNDENGLAYYYLGLIAYKLGKSERACVHFTKALNLGEVKAEMALRVKCR
ncbi:MAG: tetratricopeptide repeat protein [Kordia sp.]|uniref:tetratricopeptide repeat protein n=1 Tax=Kordia sp. TaxID=1965332 RepID=UPI00385AE28B